jgi:hypothetical protein
MMNKKFTVQVQPLNDIENFDFDRPDNIGRLKADRI